MLLEKILHLEGLHVLVQADAYAAAHCAAHCKLILQEGLLDAPDSYPSHLDATHCR